MVEVSYYKQSIIKPRLNDTFNLPFKQEDVDFAIPYIDEDLPFYLDPFLLWKSPSQQDNSLHTLIINYFNRLGWLFLKGKIKEAVETLIIASECNEVGLGDSVRRIGKPIGYKTSEDILNLFKIIPQVKTNGFLHIEEIQLLVANIAKDRISDISCNFIKSFLVDYTIGCCNKYSIPMVDFDLYIYNHHKYKFVKERVPLPYNPVNRKPIILVAKRWLRKIPWINFNDYDTETVIKGLHNVNGKKLNRIQLLNFNRNNYGCIQSYVKNKEINHKHCNVDPLFKALPIYSAKRKLNNILKLPTGKDNNADKKYEDYVCQLLPSFLYPHLDFADFQSRTESGVSIRDIIFYNNTSHHFLEQIYKDYECKQIVFELKNVNEVERTHINQLNRYLKNQFGNFGILITRNKPPKKVIKNTIDLWSGQRKCVLIMDDEDIKMMFQLYENKQRIPVDVIKKKYIEFSRMCPG